MKLLYRTLLMLFMMVPVVAIAAPPDKIAELIRQGNVHELSALFAPNIEAAILDEEDINTKTKTEKALTQFFKEHKPLAVSPLHTISSTVDFDFRVLLLTTNKGVFRVSYTLKKEERNWVMIELRIEMEKVK